MFCRIRGLSLCSVALIAVLVGCEDDEIRAYKIPKDPSLPSRFQTTAPDSSVSKRPSMDWTVPDGWRRQPGQRQMRVATFEADIEGQVVEIAVSAFPDRAGGLLANVNRWRGQINLNPIGQKDLASTLVPFSNESTRGYTLDFTGTASDSDEVAPERILGAIIEGVSMTWFVKAKDQPTLLEPLKGNIDQFARSFRVKVANEPGHNHPPVASNSGDFKKEGWHPPQHWKLDTTASTILSAAYNIHTPKGHARATVTALVGDGGGLLPNVNRWRHQLGLPPVNALTEQLMMPIGTLSGSQSVAAFDLLAQAMGPEGRLRFLVAVLPHQNKTWYVKLTGTDVAVELEKEAFEKWVTSIRLTHIHP